MLKSRVIPVLLMREGGLVKTVNFKEGKYVGDPLNAVRIFNEKECDELVVLDIDASPHQREPSYKLIENLAAECRMPLCYGGGINNLEQAKRILGLGVEKISLSTALYNDKSSLVEDLSSQVGCQSVVATLDVKRRRLKGGYSCYMKNGTVNTKIELFDFAKSLCNRGVGEIMINSIDNDGTMKGYDLKLVSELNSVINVPLTALGGAGQYEDMSNLVRQEGIIGVAAGSLFVFKGKYRAVLINYPNHTQKESICNLENNLK